VERQKWFDQVLAQVGYPRRQELLQLIQVIVEPG